MSIPLGLSIYLIRTRLRSVKHVVDAKLVKDLAKRQRVSRVSHETYGQTKLGYQLPVNSNKEFV